MGRYLALALAGLMVLAGGLATLQGLGYLEGGPMSGVRAWTIVGPLIAGFGVALGLVVVRDRR